MNRSSLLFSQGRDTASPRSAMWGEALSQESADVPCSITNSPVRESDPSLSESASAFVKKEVGGGEEEARPDQCW